ncbi:hypothetical protein [Microbacterium sp. JAI119]|uniref:hypothetical protein n=1 Tax=Microbacterium sp. JAI119 TaxID=2723062 RepID=UPI0015C8E991|nr:hypothetical protein [Microbacterium sp. JAI119]NYF28099.1 hypothetical protein [Microbacterium sp. JAI119]
MTDKNVDTLGDWLKRPITWLVLAVAGIVFVVLQVFAPGIFSGSDRETTAGTEIGVERAPGVEVAQGSEIVAVYPAENREDTAVEISAAEITYLRVEGGPECTGASRAGVQAKLENHLVGKRIDRGSGYEFEVIYTGRDEPVPDCVGATIQAEVEIRVVPYK